jgi:AcrR family transcriptional regulator
MLEAAAQLLQREGPDAVTHLRVSQEAGVARATVYHHWSDRTSLVIDVLLSGAGPNIGVSEVDDLSVIDAVTRVLQGFASILNSENGKIIATLIGRAEWEDEALQAKRRIAGIGIGRLAATLQQAADTGELDLDSSAEMLADRLVGPLYSMRLIRHEPIPDGYVPELVRVVLAPLVASSR